MQRFKVVTNSIEELAELYQREAYVYSLENIQLEPGEMTCVCEYVRYLQPDYSSSVPSPPVLELSYESFSRMRKLDFLEKLVDEAVLLAVVDEALKKDREDRNKHKQKARIKAQLARLTARELLSPVLQVTHRAISTFLSKQAGLKRAHSATGAVTLIQRFGAAANLNKHA